MSLSSKISKVKAQGYLRTLELQFNRFIPPWIFRYSMGDIFDIDLEKLRSLESLRPSSDNKLAAKCLEPDSSDNDRMRLREFTWNSVPLESTANDLGYMIYDSREPDKILGGVWVSIGSFSEDNLGFEVHFQEHQNWLYCAFVHSDARGRGVYKKLMSFVAEDLHNRGCSQLFCIVQPWNKNSWRIHDSQSRGIYGRISATRLFFLVWVSTNGHLDVDKRLVTNVASNPVKIRTQ